MSNQKKDWPGRGYQGFLENLGAELFVKHREDLERLEYQTREFYNQHGLAPNAIFVGPHHWLARAHFRKLYSLKIVVVEPHEAMIGLSLTKKDEE